MNQVAINAYVGMLQRQREEALNMVAELCGQVADRDSIIESQTKEIAGLRAMVPAGTEEIAL